ncbi:MAG: hypothetical protein JNL21_08220 [Myxococcales bacterium]|nr:hypothetical protein [Myxococcales bacterium]
MDADVPGVVIEVPAGDRSIAEEGPLVAACSVILAEGDCVVGAGERRAIAVVSWADDRHLRATIEVRLRHRDGTFAQSETNAAFGERDPAAERWRAMGLLIGTAVNQLSQDAPDESRSPPAAPPRARPVPPSPRSEVTLIRGVVVPERPPSTLWLRAGGLLEVELASGAPRGGGMIDVGYFAADVFELRLGGHFSRRPGEASTTVDRLAATGGLGIRVFRTELGFVGLGFLDIGPEAVIAMDATSSGSRATVVARAGVELAYTNGLFCAGLTSGLSREWQSTTVAVDGVRLYDMGPYALSWALAVGLGL